MDARFRESCFLKSYDVHLKPAQFIVDHSSFRASLTCCRLSDRPSVIVLTFQVPSLSAGTLCFPFVLFGAMIAIRLSGVVHKPHAPMGQTNCGGTAPIWLGAAQLEAGGSCAMRSEDLSHH